MIERRNIVACLDHFASALSKKYFRAAEFAPEKQQTNRLMPPGTRIRINPETNLATDISAVPGSALFTSKSEASSCFLFSMAVLAGRIQLTRGLIDNLFQQIISLTWNNPTIIEIIVGARHARPFIITGGCNPPLQFRGYTSFLYGPTRSVFSKQLLYLKTLTLSISTHDLHKIHS